MGIFDNFKKRPSGDDGIDPATRADIEARHNLNPARDNGDRSLPSVNSKKPGNKVVNMIGIGFIAALGLYLIYQLNTTGDRKELAALKKQKIEAEQNAISGSLPKIGSPPKPPMPTLDEKQPDATPIALKTGFLGTPDQVPAPDGSPGKPITVAENGKARPGGATGPNGKPIKTPYELILERRRNGLLNAQFDEDEKNAAGATASGENANRHQDVEGSLFAQGGSSDALSKSLQPTRTKGTMAGLISDRNFVLAKSSFLDCTLETRLISTVPGMTSCILSRDIFSDNGKVKLAEAGSKVTGQYQGGLTQGQARIFVLWTRLETTHGVVVNLDSPGTDALGASGLDGYVDTHFWERFGGAIMLSLIDDFASAAANKGGIENNNQVNYGATQTAAQNMAAEALKNSINIPPTLTKNHGDHINIYVARDLDFRSVYALRSN